MSCSPPEPSSCPGPQCCSSFSSVQAPQEAPLLLRARLLLLAEDRGGAQQRLMWARAIQLAQKPEGAAVSALDHTTASILPGCPSELRSKASGSEFVLFKLLCLAAAKHKIPKVSEEGYCELMGLFSFALQPTALISSSKICHCDILSSSLKNDQGN